MPQNWTAPCHNHYRNDDALFDFGFVREILYGFVDDGVLVKSMRFKGVFVNFFLLSWMLPDFLLQSCWEDLENQDKNFFSVIGDENLHRRFFINHKYGGCDNVQGWTVAIDQENPQCDWEKNEAFPSFKYVAGQKYENMSSARVRSADAIVVFVNYAPTDISMYHDLFNIGYRPWILAFRGTAKVGTPVLPAYVDGSGINPNMEDACRTVDWRAPCTSHYRNNDALNYWKDIEEVIFGIIQGGEMVKTIFFSGEGTNYLNWFGPEHLLRSSWDDLRMGPTNRFSIVGDEKRHRHFFINRNFGGCSRDFGWMVAVDDPPKPCSWEISDGYPLFKFAAGPKGQNYKKGEVLEAEAIVVFMKLKIY